MSAIWQQHELDFLMSHYRHQSHNYLLSNLPNRTWCSIKYKALSLGLIRYSVENNTKPCCACHEIKTLDQFSGHSMGRNGKRSKCKDCLSVDGKKYYQENVEKEHNRGREKYRQLRIDVFNHYGNLCNCCGESEFEFLTIDHIIMSRTEHRKQTKGNAAGSCLYLWLRKNNFPDGFQTLCMNCNYSKFRHGQCIHKTRLEYMYE
jgi:hypothetical protein